MAKDLINHTNQSLKMLIYLDEFESMLRGLLWLLTNIGLERDSLNGCNERAVSLMDYKSLEIATENFQESNILREGGFGCVYKARLNDKVDVVLKRLDGGSQDSIKEFETGVDLLSKIQHPNVTSLLGYSIHRETRLLVYELMQNGSLETQLHGPVDTAR
ncbi:unnamed protein product [Camellia sinensis]